MKLAGTEKKEKCLLNTKKVLICNYYIRDNNYFREKKNTKTIKFKN